MWAYHNGKRDRQARSGKSCVGALMDVQTRDTTCSARSLTAVRFCATN